MSIGWYVAGAVTGAGLVAWLSNPSTCCARVSGGVRDRVTDGLAPYLGSTGAGVVGTLGDVTGLWAASPGLLDILGVS